MASKKTLRSYMIDRAGRTWNTRPEQNFQEYQLSRGMGLVQNVKLPFVSKDLEGALIHYDFQLDFAHPTDHTWDVNYEIDGSHYHSSAKQVGKDGWKDRVKNAQGLKVVHVPAILTERKWWSYLDEMLPKALLSPSATVYVIA